MEFQKFLNEDILNKLNSLRNNILQEEVTMKNKEEKEKRDELLEYSKNNYFKDINEVLDYLKKEKELCFSYEHSPRIHWVEKDGINLIEIIFVYFDDCSGVDYFDHLEYLTEEEFVKQYNQDFYKNKVGYIDYFYKIK